MQKTCTEKALDWWSEAFNKTKTKCSVRFFNQAPRKSWIPIRDSACKLDWSSKKNLEDLSINAHNNSNTEMLYWNEMIQDKTSA